LQRTTAAGDGENIPSSSWTSGNEHSTVNFMFQTMWSWWILDS